MVRHILGALRFPFWLSIVLMAALFGCSSSQASSYDNGRIQFDHPLAIPPLLAPRTENGTVIFDLTIQTGQTAFFNDTLTDTLGFNGSYLGPTIRVRTGDHVRMNITNEIDETATVHWHGMHLPAAMDGGPHQPIAPGESWQPYWTITNQAATLWYHPHMMGKTGEQVYRGLAGLLIIDDDNADSIGLPAEYGIDDIPLIVQDKAFDQNHQFVYEPHRSDIVGETGMLGDTILVNGTYAPYLDVPAKRVRLRLLNGSNARRYNFGFSDNRPFFQIATDSGLLPAPVERTRMVLAPGERAEIIIDLANLSEPLTLISDFIHDPNAGFRVLKPLLGAARDENQRFAILELRPYKTEAAGTPLPKVLNTIERLDEDQAVQTRSFSLAGDSINGKQMDHTRVDEIVRAGDMEVWEVTSLDAPHPFHVHGVQFRILDRNGSPPEAYERGWKDTVLVQRDETVRLLIQMPVYSDPHLPFMFHCHILEHEDMGMMGQFIVVDDLTQDVEVRSPLLDFPETEGMEHEE